MSKLIYTVTLSFAGPEVSKVVFLDWVPSYLRSVPSRAGHKEVVCLMESTDAIAAWIMVQKLLEKPEKPSSVGVGLTAHGGSMRVCWDDTLSKRSLTEAEIGELQSLLDKRRNPRLQTKNG